MFWITVDTASLCARTCSAPMTLNGQRARSKRSWIFGRQREIRTIVDCRNPDGSGATWHLIRQLPAFSMIWICGSGLSSSS